MIDIVKFRLDLPLHFVSIQKIDYPEWKPKMKLLTDYDIIINEHSNVHLKCNHENFYLQPEEAFLSCPGQTIYIADDTYPRTGITIIHFLAETYKPIHSGEGPSDMAQVKKDDSNHYINLSRVIPLNFKSISPILDDISEELKFRRLGYENKNDIMLLNLLYELHRSCAESELLNKFSYNFIMANRYVRQLISYLHDNYINRITSQDIERELSLNYDYANVMFKRLTGYTIMAYLEDIRLMKAKELITATSLSIQEIAHMVGFADQHYFSRRFRLIEGVPPSALRK